jgi:hypothetical protein
VIALRYTLIFLAVLLLGFHLFTFFSLDEAGLKKTVSGGVPIRFIKADQETIDDMKAQFSSLDPMPKYLLEKPKEKDFGRKQFFLPD